MNSAQQSFAFIEPSGRAVHGPVRPLVLRCPVRVPASVLLRAAALIPLDAEQCLLRLGDEYVHAREQAAGEWEIIAYRHEPSGCSWIGAAMSGTVVTSLLRQIVRQARVHTCRLCGWYGAMAASEDYPGRHSCPACRAAQIVTQNACGEAAPKASPQLNEPRGPR